MSMRSTTVRLASLTADRKGKLGHMIRACLCAPKSFEQIHHVVECYINSRGDLRLKLFSRRR